MAKLTLSPPWVIYYRELDALFKADPKVHVLFDDRKPEVKVCVESDTKAAALNELLPGKIEYGNVTLTITVVPANGDIGTWVTDSTTMADLLRVALDGNAAVSYIQKAGGYGGISATYVVFEREVVQYYTDDLSDLHGVRSTLYQDLADEVFPSHEGAFFCTDTKDPEPCKLERKWP